MSSRFSTPHFTHKNITYDIISNLSDRQKNLFYFYDRLQDTPVCLAKWFYNAIDLNNWTTRSCDISTDNHSLLKPNRIITDFHNTQNKLNDRDEFMRGKYPQSCSNCEFNSTSTTSYKHTLNKILKNDINIHGGWSIADFLYQYGLGANLNPVYLDLRYCSTETLDQEIFKQFIDWLGSTYSAIKKITVVADQIENSEIIDQIIGVYKKNFKIIKSLTVFSDFDSGDSQIFQNYYAEIAKMCNRNHIMRYNQILFFEKEFNDTIKNNIVKYLNIANYKMTLQFIVPFTKQNIHTLMNNIVYIFSLRKKFTAKSITVNFCLEHDQNSLGQDRVAVLTSIKEIVKFFNNSENYPTGMSGVDDLEIHSEKNAIANLYQIVEERLESMIK